MKINYSTDLSVSMSRRELELIKEALCDAALYMQKRADDTQERYPEYKQIRQQKADDYRTLWRDAYEMLNNIPF